MASLLDGIIGRTPPVSQTPNRDNVTRINENLININAWITSIKREARDLQTGVQNAQQATAQNGNIDCTEYLNDINDNVNRLIETINADEPLPSPFDNLPTVDNTKKMMTKGGYYYPSTSSSRRNRRKRRNKKSRR